MSDLCCLKHRPVDNDPDPVGANVSWNFNVIFAGLHIPDKTNVNVEYKVIIDIIQFKHLLTILSTYIG